MVGGLRTTDEQHRAAVEAFAPDRPSDDSDMEEFEV
jgi:hypothetical protein